MVGGAALEVDDCGEADAAGVAGAPELPGGCARAEGQSNSAVSKQTVGKYFIGFGG